MCWYSDHGQVEQRRIDLEFVHDPPALDLPLEIQIRVSVRTQPEETGAFRFRRSIDLRKEASEIVAHSELTGPNVSLLETAGTSGSARRPGELPYLLSRSLFQNLACSQPVGCGGPTCGCVERAERQRLVAGYYDTNVPTENVVVAECNEDRETAKLRMLEGIPSLVRSFDATAMNVLTFAR